MFVGVVKYAGAPQTVFLNVTSVDVGVVSFVLVIKNKTTTRLPEAMFLKFNPVGNSGWKIDSMGEW